MARMDIMQELKNVIRGHDQGLDRKKLRIALNSIAKAQEEQWAEEREKE